MTFHKVKFIAYKFYFTFLFFLGFNHKPLKHHVYRHCDYEVVHLKKEPNGTISFSGFAENSNSQLRQSLNYLVSKKDFRKLLSCRETPLLQGTPSKDRTFGLFEYLARGISSGFYEGKFTRFLNYGLPLVILTNSPEVAGTLKTMFTLERPDNLFEQAFNMAKDYKDDPYCLDRKVGNLFIVYIKD